MINKKNLYKPYKGCLVDVGVPHIFIEDRLFFHTGLIIDVTDKQLLLKKINGFKVISLENIREFIVKKGGDKKTGI